MGLPHGQNAASAPLDRPQFLLHRPDSFELPTAHPSSVLAPQVLHQVEVLVEKPGGWKVQRGLCCLLFQDLRVGYPWKTCGITASD